MRIEKWQIGTLRYIDVIAGRVAWGIMKRVTYWFGGR